MTTSPAEPAGPADLVVIGAGPAGLAAAASAAAAGARVVLLDNGSRPGGQYWRHRGDGDTGGLHHDWAVFQGLRAELRAQAGRVEHRAGHAVWHVERDAAGVTVHALAGGRESVIRAAAVVLATGAYDRQLPFPGWTLPGVRAGRRSAVAGTGPFLAAVAAGLARSGVEVAGVFEAGHPAGFGRFPRALARNAAKLGEGAGFLATLARHRIPYRTRTAVIAAHGDGELTRITTASVTPDWTVVPGTEAGVECDALAVGYGFTPQLELALQLDCGTALDADGSLIAVADTRQRASTGRVYLAGEVCGVAGSAAAVTEGRLAGLAAAEDLLGAAPDPRRLGALLRRRRALREFAAALHRTFPVPPGWTGWLTPDTPVCRCEEVGAAAVDDAIDRLGAADPRAVKLYARPGMGLCQGRVCGWATCGLVAARAGRTPTAGDLRTLAARPVATPVPLGAIAADPAEPED
jgi:NADPH-dependent 2,4-dienoyl-CoA reductase/sulfur reductase-like enzyme